jgi:hypothetical protein
VHDRAERRRRLLFLERLPLDRPRRARRGSPAERDEWRGSAGQAPPRLRPGASEKDVIDANAIAHDAISAANAAERRDGDAFTRATARLDQDFNSDDGSSSREDLKHLKTCR